MKKNLITALKKLVTSFGGEGKSNNAVDLVDEFADIAAQGGGGSGQFVVTFSGTTENNDATCNKTFAEISEAYVTGKEIVFRYMEDGCGDDKSFTSLFNVIVDIANNTPIEFSANSNGVSLLQNLSNGYTLSVNIIRCRINEEILNINIDNEQVDIS